VTQIRIFGTRKMSILLKPHCGLSETELSNLPSHSCYFTIRGTLLWMPSAATATAVALRGLIYYEISRFVRGYQLPYSEECPSCICSMLCTQIHITMYLPHLKLWRNYFLFLSPSFFPLSLLLSLLPFQRFSSASQFTRLVKRL
jgi:hypothetical protein